MTNQPVLEPSGRGLSLTALSVADTVRVLIAAGWREATESAVLADLAAGAPRNADGTLNLMTYAAWLAKENVHAD